MPETLEALCGRVMYKANQLAEECITFLEELDEKPDEPKPKRFRRAKVSSKRELKKLPVVVKRIKKAGAIIDDDRKTSWKILVNDNDKFPKVGVIKPLTGKLEVLEKVGRKTEYRTCTLKDILKAIKRKS